MLLLKPPPMEFLEGKPTRFSSRFSLWLKGFLINTINPFTFFFWIGVTGILLKRQALQPAEAGWFYAGLFGTIMATDCAKVALAKYIRRWLSPGTVIFIRKAAGATLLVFGIVLFVRALYP
jgi:threonine/homoserine/homoserine lactone efflux protein